MEEKIKQETKIERKKEKSNVQEENLSNDKVKPDKQIASNNNHNPADLEHINKENNEEEIAKTKEKIDKKTKKDIKKEKREKKTEAVVNGKDLPISTKHAIAICNFIRGKDIDFAIQQLEDVKKYNLESEECSYGKSNPVMNLRENGATPAEIEFLCSKSSYYGSSGRRVELNALSSRGLLNLIESKLKKHGVKKVVPDNKTLKDAFRRAALVKRLNEQLKEIIGGIEKEVDDIEITPKQIARNVKKILNACSTKSWDDAVIEIAEDNHWRC